MTDDGEEVIRDGWRGEIVDGYFFPIERASAEAELWIALNNAAEDVFSRPSHAPREGQHTADNEALRPTGYRADNTVVSMSLERNGYPQAQAAEQAWDSRGIGLAGVLLVILACIGSCLFMALFDGAISFVR